MMKVPLEYFYKIDKSKFWALIMIDVLIGSELFLSLFTHKMCCIWIR